MPIRPDILERLHGLQVRNNLRSVAMRDQAPRFETLAGRHENGTAPRAVSSFNLFQTPRLLAERMARMLNIEAGARVLEPSAGLGRLVDAVLSYGPVTLSLVEQSADLCAELRRKYGGANVIYADFLTVEPFAGFDWVIMNPPFHMRADIRHVEHALKFLRPGGRLAGICMAGPHRDAALMPLADTWEELPEDTFAESGTKTRTVLFTINKN